MPMVDRANAEAEKIRAFVVEDEPADLRPMVNLQVVGTAHRWKRERGVPKDRGGGFQRRFVGEFSWDVVSLPEGVVSWAMGWVSSAVMPGARWKKS